MRIKKRGFTLVELMLYMALMASILVVLTEVFLSVLSIQAESSEVSNIDIDGRYVLARMFYDVNRADDIVVPASLGQTGASAQLTIGGTNYTYGLGANEELTILQNGVSSKLTSPGTKISNLTFTRLGNVGGENSLMIKFKITSGTQSRNYQTSVALR